MSLSSCSSHLALQSTLIKNRIPFRSLTGPTLLFFTTLKKYKCLMTSCGVKFLVKLVIGRLSCDSYSQLRSGLLRFGDSSLFGEWLLLPVDIQTAAITTVYSAVLVCHFHSSFYYFIIIPFYYCCFLRQHTESIYSLFIYFFNNFIPSYLFCYNFLSRQEQQFIGLQFSVPIARHCLSSKAIRTIP